MPRELIYTSAVQGLFPGSRGFCTVASSPDMTRPLLLMLESLSAYRHVHTSGPETSLNPVAFCHFIVAVAGQTYHVVSRIADAGLDYTRRTNVIAHHMVVTPSEQERMDPGAILSLPEIFVDHWNEAPRHLAPRELDVAPLDTQICRTWHSMVGDARWGGLLAATVESNRPAYLVYRPGQAILPLINEALALLPTRDRWRVGFSTFFQKIPPGVVCSWKGVLEGSAEAATARATPGALILDCTRTRPVPNATNETELYYMEAAHSGVLKPRETAEKRRVVKKVPLAARNLNVPVPNQDKNELEPYVPDSSFENGSSPFHEGMPHAYRGTDSETLDRLAELNSFYSGMARPQKRKHPFLLQLGLFLLATLAIGALFLFIYREDVSRYFFHPNEVSVQESSDTIEPDPAPDTSSGNQ